MWLARERRADRLLEYLVALVVRVRVRVPLRLRKDFAMGDRRVAYSDFVCAPHLYYPDGRWLDVGRPAWGNRGASVGRLAEPSGSAAEPAWRPAEPADAPPNRNIAPPPLWVTWPWHFKDGRWWGRSYKEGPRDGGPDMVPGRHTEQIVRRKSGARRVWRESARKTRRILREPEPERKPAPLRRSRIR